MNKNLLDIPVGLLTFLLVFFALVAVAVAAGSWS